MKSLLAIATVLFYSQLARSEGCPLPHPEYAKLLEKLQGFTQVVNKDAQCESITKNLVDLQKYYQARNQRLAEMARFHQAPPINAIPAMTGKKELSIADIDEISHWSEAITSVVGTLVENLKGQKNCVPGEHQGSILTAMASITAEVSRFAAAYSGPYEAPIRVGGASIAGILRGIDLIVESYKDGYDFDIPEDRRLFVYNMCSYHDIRREVNDLIDPRARIQIFQTVIRELKTKQDKLMMNSKAATEFAKYFELLERVQPSMSSMREHLSSTSRLSLNSWETCTQLSELVHDRNSELSLLVAGLPAYNIPDDHLAQKTLAFARSTKGIPVSLDCWKVKEADLPEVNKRSAALISHTVDAVEKYFQNILRYIQSKASNEPWVNNYAEKIEHTFQKRNWSIREINKLSELTGDESYSVRRELTENKVFLDKKLFEDLSPRYLQWYLDDAEEFLETYAKAKRDESKKLGREAGVGGSIEEVVNGVQSRNDPQFNHSMVYFALDKLLTMVHGSAIAAKNISVFCGYYTEAGLVDPKTSKICSGSRLSEINQRLKTELSVLVTFENYLDWCHQHQKIKADWVKALIEKIKRCHVEIGTDYKGNPNATVWK